jgi:hypothetical protein
MCTPAYLAEISLVEDGDGGRVGIAGLLGALGRHAEPLQVAHQVPTAVPTHSKKPHWPSSSHCAHERQTSGMSDDEKMTTPSY